MPIWIADVLRLLAELLLYALSLVPAGAAFVWLWQRDTFLMRVLAFPTAYAGLVIGFWVVVALYCIVFLWKITPGTYKLTDAGAVRWIVSDSLVRILQRSPLRGYIDGFGPPRYIFYRLMGAKVDASFFFGWHSRILDPWGIEVGRNVIIGSFAVISAHAVEGDTVVLSPVKIGDGATIGVRSLILPGVNIGAGAIVGAGAVVTKNTTIPPGEIWAGVPAKKIGETAHRTGADATEEAPPGDGR